MIALERRFLDTAGIVKEICGVEGAVAQELVRASMKLVGAGARYRVDHSAGSSPVLGGYIARQHREFLDGVDADIAAQNAARSSVSKILNADAVQAVIVLLGARAIDGYFILKTAIAAVGPGSERRLSFHRKHTGLQCCQVGPRSSV